MKKFNLLLLFIIFTSFFISIIPINTKALSDLSYTFDDNLIYENDNIELQNSFNLKYIESYTDIYNATFSFTNEIDGTNDTDIVFVDSVVSGIDATIQINNTDSTHNKVIEMNDNNNTVFTTLDHDIIAPRFSGTYEFWFKSSDTGLNQDFPTKNSIFTLNGVYLGIAGSVADKLQYFDGAWNNIDDIVDNTWYHVRVDYECGAGGYEGLAPDTFHLYLNSEKYSDLAFRDNVADIGRLTFQLFSQPVILLIDAIGFAPSIPVAAYPIGLNRFPFLNVSENLQEINRYEFAMSNIDTFHPTGADSTNGWTDIEVGGGDKVGIAVQGNVNGLIYSSTNVGADFRGTEKTSLGINGIFINITVAIIPETMDGILNEIRILIYDSDDILITRLFINSDLSVEATDDGGNFNLNRDVILGIEYEFNFMLNYEMDRCFLIYTKNDIVQEIYDYTLIQNNKQGLNKIEVYSFNNDANTISYFIDYIGIYNNGVPQVAVNDDFGLSTRLLDGVSNWNYEHNNLVNIIANGIFHLGAVDGGNYFRGSTLLQLRDTFNYVQTETTFLNVYDEFISEVSIPRLVFTLVSGSFNVSYFKIDGVILNESSNSYNLIYEHDNININESYFYVVGSKLLFNHISNDTTLEFIQARFNINDVSSNEYSISYRSVIQNNAFGFLRINFTLTSSLVQFPNIERITRAIIPQNQTIRDFIVLITDRDIDGVSGLTTGSIDSIQLIITQNIGTSIIISSLINMMVPLIMILIPTLALSNRYGKNLIIPMFLLMSVICVVSALIPVWLFFIIAISSSLTLLKKRDDFI